MANDTVVSDQLKRNEEALASVYNIAEILLWFDELGPNECPPYPIYKILARSLEDETRVLEKALVSSGASMTSPKKETPAEGECNA